MKLSPKLLVSITLLSVILVAGLVWGYSLSEPTKKIVSRTVSSSVSSSAVLNTSSSLSVSSSTDTSLPQPTPSPVPTPTQYSKTAVAAHSTSSDCWIIINDQVLDVTDYLPGHPGGASAITPYCGKDATTAFRSIRKHNGFAQKLISEFVISPLQ
jgi:cytochrome b involved in lipid metabolism